MKNKNNNKACAYSLLDRIFCGFCLICAVCAVIVCVNSFACKKSILKRDTKEQLDMSKVPHVVILSNHCEAVKTDDSVLPVVYKTEKAYRESLGVFTLTAYCPCERCCGEWANNRPTDEFGNQVVYGSTGNRLVSGRSIAVDPTVIVYGSVVEIAGERYVAHDCGGAIKGNRIDVFFDSHDEAVRFGVKEIEVLLVCGG